MLPRGKFGCLRIVGVIFVFVVVLRCGPILLPLPRSLSPPPLSPSSLSFCLLIVRLSMLPMPHRRHIFVVFVVEVEAPFLCPFPLPLLPIAAYAPPSSSASLATPLAAAAGAFILMMSQYRIWGRATVGQKKNGTEAQNGTNRHKPAQIFKLTHLFWGVSFLPPFSDKKIVGIWFQMPPPFPPKKLHSAIYSLLNMLFCPKQFFPPIPPAN